MVDIKRCSKCKKDCLKTNFYKNKNKKYGVKSFCRICMNKYMNEYIKHRIKRDVNFGLVRNSRRRIHKALNGNLKSSSTNEILGIGINLYRKWIEWQMTRDMTWDNIEVDHIKVVCSFDVSKDEDLKEAFNWRKHTTTSQTGS